VKQYEDLSNKANRTAAEEAALKQVTVQLTDVMPEARSGFDSLGNALLNSGNMADIAKGKIAGLKEEVIGYYKLRADMAGEQLTGLNSQYEGLNSQLQSLQNQQKINESGKWDITLFGRTFQNPLAGEMGDSNYINSQIKNLREEQLKIAKDRLSLEQDQAIYQSIQNGTYFDKPSTASTGGTPTNSGGLPWTPPDNKKAVNAAKTLTEAVTAALYPYKTATDAAANAVSILGAKEQYLSQVMQSGQANVSQAIELNRVRTQQYGALAQQEEAVHQQADAERVALAALQQKYQQATDPDAIKELQSEMTNLVGSINQAGQAWWQAEQQKLSITEQLRQADEKRYTDAYQEAMDLMRHQVNMAQMSTDQQIYYLEKLRDAHKWSTQQMWELDEQLYSLRRQQLNEYLSIMEDEYNSKLDAITAKTKATTDAIQSQIDSLDKEGTQSDREETTRQHNQKLQDLMDQKNYHELRTGKEHKQAITDIDKQIAEEQLLYQQQQEKWARDDKKDALQQQLDDAKQAGEDERDRLEEHYKEVMKLANQGALDTLAALAAKNPEWWETGKNGIKNLMDGITTMEPEFQAKIQEATSLMGGYQDQAGSTTITSPNIPTADKVPSSWQDALTYYQSHLNEALAEIQRAGTVYAQKMAAGDKDGAAAAHRWADQLRKAIEMPMVFDSNTESSPSVHNSYDKGGYIFYDQIARLHAGEYVMPANLVEAIRMMNPPTGRSNYSSQGGGEKVVHNEQYFYAPLVGVDKQYINDDIDNTVFARETVGLISSVRRSGG